MDHLFLGGTWTAWRCMWWTEDDSHGACTTTHPRWVSDAHDGVPAMRTCTGHFGHTLLYLARAYGIATVRALDTAFTAPATDWPPRVDQRSAA